MGNLISGLNYVKSFIPSFFGETLADIPGIDLETAKNGLLGLMKPIDSTPPLLKVFQEVKSSHEGKRVVLVIGPTGSGKSTLVTYLQGHEIEFNGAGDAIGPVNKQLRPNKDYPSIGSSRVNSETYRPMVFPSKEGDLLYTDCPGFFDTNVGSRQVMASIGLELAVKNAAAIHAVIIVVNYHALDVSKGVDFGKMADYLSDLFGEQLDRYADSIYFVFNRALVAHPIKGTIPRTPDQIASDIKVRIQEINDNLKIAAIPKNGVSQEKIRQLEKIKGIFEMMVNQSHSRKKLLCINITNQNSRKSLEEKLLNHYVNAVPKNAFHFNAYEGAKKTIVNYALKVAYCALTDLKKNEQQREYGKTISLSTINTKINELRKLIQSCQSRIAEERPLLFQKKLELQRKIKFIKGELEKAENTKNNMEKAFAKQEFYIKQITSKLAKLDTNEEIRIWSDKSEQPYSFWDGYHVKDYKYNKPYTRIEAFELGARRNISNNYGNPVYGKFNVKSNNPKEGKFHAIYESNRFYGAFHQVNIYVTKRVLHKEEIAKIVDELIEFQFTLPVMQSDIRAQINLIQSINSEIKSLQTEIQNIELNNTHQEIEEKIKNYGNEILLLESNKINTKDAIKDVESKIESCKQIPKISITQYYAVYNAIKVLSTAMTFPPTIKTFLDRFSSIVPGNQIPRESENLINNRAAFYKPVESHRKPAHYTEKYNVARSGVL